MIMMVEMVNSKQFEKRYHKYYEKGSFDKYVDRLIEKFDKSGKNIKVIDVFKHDALILTKRADNDFVLKFIPDISKPWWKFW
jgi:hypothetical protein